MPHRRIEVVVLGVRGLNLCNDGERARRQIELAVVCPIDATGEEFGTKTSPWVLPTSGSKMIWFGKSGVRAFFPLEGPRAPDIADDKRFRAHAELRVRLYTSGVNSASPTVMLAQSFLPTKMANAATKELDKATAQLEAETRIALDDMLASEPHAYRNGWTDIHRTNVTDDPAMPQIWMQVFVLPDQEEHIPQFNADYEAEGKHVPNFRCSPCAWMYCGAPASQAADRDCVDKSRSLERELTGSAQVAMQTATKEAPKAAAQQVVVPPGVNPGESFVVQGVMLDHKVTCPPDKKAGDTWRIVSPTSHRLMSVEIPPDVKPGQDFIVKEMQMRQAQCPEGASPGDTVQLAPIVALPAPSPDVIHVVCPTGKGPGDLVPVYIQQRNATAMVEVPLGVLPGMVFPAEVLQNEPPIGPQISVAPEVAPSTDLLGELVEATATPPMIVPSTDTSSQLDLLGGDAGTAAGSLFPVVPELPSVLPQQVEVQSKTLDLPALYAEQAKDPNPKIGISSPGKLQADKFAPLGRVGKDEAVADPCADQRGEEMSLQALQDNALAGLAQSSGKRKNAKGEIETFI